MLEVFIIICLALAFFLVMRRFPKDLENNVSNIDPEKIEKETIVKWNFFKKRENELDNIKDEISRGQEQVVAPSDIDTAQRRYMEEDPLLARELLEADKAIDAGDLRTAEDIAIAAIKQNKRCAQAYVIIGRVAQQRGVFDEAKEAYKVAKKCNSELAEPYYGLGQIDLKDENYSDAIENLQRAVILDRSRPDWYATLGKAYMEVRQFARAAKALKRAASLDMDNKEYKDLAAEAEEKQRTHSQAFRSR